MLDSIEADLKTALLAGESLDVEVLKSLKNSLLLFAKDQKHEPSDEESIKIVQKEIKKRLEAAQIYSKAGSKERATKESSEAEILKKYLPEQLSEKEINKVIERIFADNDIDSPQKLGMAIGLARKEIGSKADGSTIARIVKNKLGIPQ